MQEKSENFYDAIVVGLGVYGLSIGYFLAKQNLKVLLIDQYEVGHGNGSSHSSSRITRSTYEKSIYRDLNQLCLKQVWPQLQKQFGQKLVYPNSHLYFDESQQSYEKYKIVASSSGDTLKIMTLQEVNQKYPCVPIVKTNLNPIVDDHSGIIAADVYLNCLKKALLSFKNVIIKQKCQITGVSDTSNKKQYACVKISNNEQFLGKKIVLSCGRWISELVPSIKSLLSVAKQYIGYAELKNMDIYKVGKCSSFVYHRKNDEIYALPQLKKRGFKFAQHGMRELKGAQDTKEYQWNKLEQIAKDLFGDKFIKLNEIQECYYTATRTQDFIIDWTSPKQNILICSCCSGHGFKFGPILGKIISELLMHDKSIEVFQKSRYMFRIPYHQGVNLQ